jgi:hypothetical protein
VSVLSQRLLTRFKAIESHRRMHWDDKYQTIADDVIGRREFTNHGEPGRRRDKRLYDTTARTMVNLLAGGLHSLLTNPATEWFKLSTRQPMLMEIYAVQAWLDDVTDHLLSIFQAPTSRFASQSDEVYLDVVGFGTGGLFVGDPPGQPILFSSRPLPELYIAENEAGIVDTVFRKFKMSARNIVDRWGPQAPEKARIMVEGGKSEDKLDVLHCVEPNTDPTLRGLSTGPFAFLSAFIDLATGEMIGDLGGYEENPYIIWRWRVDGGEVLGRGPAEDSLADTRMLHAMNKTQLQAGQMGVAPPFLTEDQGSIVQLDLRPFGRNIVKPGGILNPPIQSMDIKTQNLLSVEMVRDKRGQVEESFHFELLKLIQNRGLTPMTARQTASIEGAVQRLLAPILGRAHVEWIYPLIDRVFGIELRRGNLPPPPMELSGQALKVEPLSPITRAQRSGDVDAVARWLGGLVEFSQVNPDVLDLANIDEAWRFMATHSSVPASIVNDPKTVAQKRKARADLAAQQDSMDEASQVAATAKDAAGALSQLQQ